MKKLLFTTLALTGMIACNKVEVTGPIANPEIAFGDSFVEIKTRTAEDPSITSGNIDKFDVWSFMDETPAMILNKERVTKVTTGWEYNNLQYWLGGHTYYFGAIAPVDHSNIGVSTSGANQFGLGEITFTNLDGTDDLIYASKAITTDEDVINNDPGKIHLQFAHLLSKVKFTFTNGFTTDNIKMTIKNVQMTAPESGKINLAQENWWTDNKWQITDEEDGKFALKFGDVNGGAKIDASTGEDAISTAECATELFTIPAGISRAYTITFDIALYVGTYETPAYSVTRTVNLTGQELKIGKKYNFKTTIGPKNIHPDGPLHPIEFEIIEVKPWEEDVANALPLAK